MAAEPGCTVAERDGKKGGKDERGARLAQALKANLRRRKQQARERQADVADDKTGPAGAGKTGHS